MKAVILAGGFGTRISEESHLKPKPMIEIGEQPILWHIMKLYSYYGVNDFIICAGYKQQMIKEYFANYFLYRSDITFDIKENAMHVHNSHTEPWKVTVVDTGLNTMTGGRIKRIAEYIKDETFLLTYGDAVSDIDIGELISFHKTQDKLLTLTSVRPKGRFGALEIEDTGRIVNFSEKGNDDSGWVNAGFMVAKPDVFSYIESDSTIFEQGPLQAIADVGQLMAFKHSGFWQCMDTQREKQQLEALWQGGSAPWKVWGND